MNPTLVLLIFVGYVLLLLGIAHLTSTKGQTANGNAQFFIAEKAAPWYAVAFGMIGASLSGVTFISVPGWVESSGFTYMQMVLGYLVGYGFIMLVLLPLYYRMGLTSIYGYFGSRFGKNAYLTGAGFFILSRTIGAAFRLFLVGLVLKLFVLEPLGWNTGIGYALTIFVIISVIWAYTRQGGLGTIVWTDTLQTATMLIAVAASAYVISTELGWTGNETIQNIRRSPMSDWFIWTDWKASHHFIKDFLAGAFIAATMTGMDQDMMQKNLACRNLRDARWNMGTLAITLVFINLLFLSLGVLLYTWTQKQGIEVAQSDSLFPTVALGGTLGFGIALMFLIGLLASAFSSADSAMTALTTSICIDVLKVEERQEKESVSLRKKVHVGVALALFGVILIFSEVNDTSVVKAIFTAANYTYGPILGLFCFGLLTKKTPIDRAIPVVGILSPLACYGLESALVHCFDFSFGFALLPVNGIITFIGLLLISRKNAINF
ncbi:MAG: sodium:solute symporter [Flavobacteriales bacterium]